MQKAIVRMFFALCYNSPKGEDEPMEEFEYYPSRPMMLLLEIGQKRYYANLRKGAACDAFIASIAPSLRMVDFLGYGKCASLSTMKSYPGDAMHIVPGDLVALPDGQILLCYQEQDIQATPLAHIASLDPHEFSSLLGDGDVEVCLSIEWSE